jgi:hypothetical protein
MRVNRARVLLHRRLGRLLRTSIMSFAITCTGCIVPPDGERPVVSTNVPPEIRLDSIKPNHLLLREKADLSVGQICPITFEVTVIDLDDCVIDWRIVADNFRNIAVVLESQEDELLPRGECGAPPYQGSFSRKIDPSPITGLTEGPHTITLFVKDADDDWELGDDEIQMSPTFDGGRLAEPAEGEIRDGTVVSYTWTAVWEQGRCR